jgi:hypothetical protein
MLEDRTILICFLIKLRAYSQWSLTYKFVFVILIIIFMWRLIRRNPLATGVSTN